MDKKISGSKVKNNDGLTPLMKQYYEVKNKYPDALLLFRVGDFYETFGEDAVKVASILGIILTSRNNGGSNVELAGFPYHSLDIYLPKLVRAGYRVAICDQLEKPSKEKKIVKRGVTNVVTPGLTSDDSLLQSKSNNFLCSIYMDQKHNFGIAFLDLSTGEFIVSEGDLSVVESLLQRFNTAEVIYQKSKKKESSAFLTGEWPSFGIEDWIYQHQSCYERLTKHFNVSSLKGFGIEEMKEAHIAAGSILYYLGLNENNAIKHISGISKIPQDDYMWLDKFTIRNLELVSEGNTERRSLLEVIDHCVTPMGTRLLHKWLLMPLLSLNAINARLNIVQFFLENQEFSHALFSQLKLIGDLERLLAKSAMGRIQPREVLQLKKALNSIQEINELLLKCSDANISMMGEVINPCVQLTDLIAETLNPDAPTLLIKGNVINIGVNNELDENRYLIHHAKEAMEELLAKESEISNIQNLKLGFNNVFGYYFEVTAKNKHITPPENWIRKQTLTNAERYVTQEIKNLEVRILNAEGANQELEEKIYSELLLKINDHIEAIQTNCNLIARIDCLHSFSTLAARNAYSRPVFNHEDKIEIVQGRHPIIEAAFGHEKKYIPNDLSLDTEQQQIIILTGPNMAGKSAVLRQTGLICILGQIGSYVPAELANLCIIDKLFTRVGASDNISGGESTFMVEMNETASIMNNITDRSLILLDEIGRGTATYDGISIAWALAEFLHDNPVGRPKTLFATHYHELNELANKLERVNNYNVSVKETKDKVIFLYQLTKGGSEHSFGIHVAKMAGMPDAIIKRANQILSQLEEKSVSLSGKGKHIQKAVLESLKNPVYQMSIFETNDPMIGEIREILLAINPEVMTPIESLLKLKELQDLAIKSLD